LIVRDLLFVAIGGSLGALTRYAIGIGAAHLLGKNFPWGTLIVNVSGCFVMGLVVEIVQDLESHSSEFLTPAIRLQLALWHKAIAIGFLGGLTTFSTFGADTMRELSGGRPIAAIANVVASVACSLLAVWCGMALMQAID
jgi:fluoride exporter